MENEPYVLRPFGFVKFYAILIQACMIFLIFFPAIECSSI